MLIVIHLSRPQDVQNDGGSWFGAALGGAAAIEQAHGLPGQLIDRPVDRDSDVPGLFHADHRMVMKFQGKFCDPPVLFGGQDDVQIKLVRPAGERFFEDAPAYSGAGQY